MKKYWFLIYCACLILFFVALDFVSTLSSDLATSETSLMLCEGRVVHLQEFYDENWLDGTTNKLKVSCDLGWERFRKEFNESSGAPGRTVDDIHMAQSAQSCEFLGKLKKADIMYKSIGMETIILGLEQ